MTSGVFTIGVVAPAARIERTIIEPVQDIASKLFGPKVQLLFHPDSFIGSGHFSANDQTRANAILEYATSDAIDAIWFGRGGYGAARILPLVLPKLAGYALQKPYLGYSDLGSLLSALYKIGSRNIAHGPMPHDITRVNGEAAVERALRWLVERSPVALEASATNDMPTMAFNLTVLAHLIGTPWEPDLSGHIIQIEEVSEHLYRIDRCFGQLAQAETFRRAAGIRLGRFNSIIANDPDFGMTPEEIARHWCSVAAVPFLGTADIGHDAENKVVPFGSIGLSQ